MVNVGRQRLQNSQTMVKCRICGRDGEVVSKHRKKPVTLSRCNSCRKRMNRYKITEEQLTEFILNPNCGICDKELDPFNMCIDHCHETGVVRGILCREHNLMIGYAKDNIDILLNSIKYLNKCTEDNLEVPSS